MCAVMNGASDLKLALAVDQAGAMPSLMIVGCDRVDRMASDLEEFRRCTGHANIVLQLNYHDLVDRNVMRLVRHYRVSHVELLGDINTDLTTRQEFDQLMADPQYRLGIKTIRSITRAFFRIFRMTPESHGIDAYALKGSDSAGFSGKLTVAELFQQQRQCTPDLPLITYGGVGTPQQVRDYITNGAAAVAVGTLFAASQESCLALSLKQQMVLANRASLTRFSTSQQALIIGDRDQVTADASPNRQLSLEAGLSGQGGLVYSGAAIDHVTGIRPAKEIVEYLVSEL